MVTLEQKARQKPKPKSDTEATERVWKCSFSWCRKPLSTKGYFQSPNSFARYCSRECYKSADAIGFD